MEVVADVYTIAKSRTHVKCDGKVSHGELVVCWEELYNLIIPKSVSMRRQKLDLEWVVNMNKADVIAYFDGCAPTWDQELSKNDEVIAEILDHAGISENMDVLDIACGTGGTLPLLYETRGNVRNRRGYLTGNGENCPREIC